MEAIALAHSRCSVAAFRALAGWWSAGRAPPGGRSANQSEYHPIDRAGWSALGGLAGARIRRLGKLADKLWNCCAPSNIGRPSSALERPANGARQAMVANPQTVAPGLSAGRPQELWIMRRLTSCKINPPPSARRPVRRSPGRLVKRAGLNSSGPQFAYCCFKQCAMLNLVRALEGLFDELLSLAPRSAVLTDCANMLHIEHSDSGLARRARYSLLPRQASVRPTDAPRAQ